MDKKRRAIETPKTPETGPRASMRERASTAIISGLEQGLQVWMDGARRNSRLVFLVFAVLTILAGYTALTGLGVNSNTKDMISDKLPYRQADAAFASAFPDFQNAALIVIRAPTPEEAEEFAEALAADLEQRPDIVKSVFAPAIDPFFQRNALLYFDTDDLDATLSRLSQAAPFLTDLIADPSLAGVLDSLAETLTLLEQGEMESDLLDAILADVAASMETRLSSGAPAPLSWQAAFQDADDKKDFAQTTLVVDPVLNFASLRPAKAATQGVIAAAEKLAAERASDRISVGITGDQVLRTEELQTVADGIVLSLSLSLIFVLILLWFALRSVILVIAALLTLVVNLILTAGFAALAIGYLNLVSVAFAVLMIGLGIDFAIHLCLHFEEERRKCADVALSVRQSARDIGPALALAAMTTALAFFAFVPTDFVGIAQLGIISGVGVLLAFGVAVTMLPAFFALLPNAKAPPLEDAVTDRMNKAFQPAVRPVAGVTVLLCIISIPLLTQVKFDADPMALRNLNSPSVRTFNLLFEDAATTPYRLQVLAADEAEAAKIAERVKDVPAVDTAVSVASFIPKAQGEKLDIIDFAASGLIFALDAADTNAPPAELDVALPRLAAALQNAQASGGGGPGATALAAALIKLDAASEEGKAAVEGDLLRFFPKQIDRLKTTLGPDFIDREDLPPALVERYVAPDGRARVEISSVLDVSDPAMRRAFVEAVQAEEPRVTGAALNVMQSGDVVARSMIQATITAGALAAFVLWVFLRNGALVALILLPLILAAALTSAASVALNMPYNFANVIVLPLLIGLGVDSGVHLALRARGAAAGYGVYATTTPRAVFFSALTTIASFGTLILSAHRGTASMGALLTIGVFATLLCTLVVLPAVLEMGRRSGGFWGEAVRKFGMVQDDKE